MPKNIRKKEWVEMHFSLGPPGPEGENSEAPAFFEIKGNQRDSQGFQNWAARGRGGIRPNPVFIWIPGASRREFRCPCFFLNWENQSVSHGFPELAVRGRGRVAVGGGGAALAWPLPWPSAAIPALRRFYRPLGLALCFCFRSRSRP